ncbi:hypothetical protein R6Q59_032031 [Mikania micrantha]
MIEEDRLSVLQDDLILKILSFVGLKDAIGTSVLSPRWRYLWMSIPHLNFSSEDFSTMERLSDFVTNVLSRRNHQVQLSSFKLYISRLDGQDAALRIMNHAFSLNVQQLNITCLFKYYSGSLEHRPGIPISVYGPQALKHFTLSWVSYSDQLILTSTRVEFSCLATLDLQDITLYDGFLSMCPNLENLTLNRCKVAGSEVLSISHPQLSNLTLEKNGDWRQLTVNVHTPQLKNLTISRYIGGFQVSAPKLTSLLIRGHCPYMFSTDGFHFLEKAQLSLHSFKWLSTSDGSTVIGLIQEFHNVKFLSLTADVIQLLNSSLQLISQQPCLLANLKSLKILPKVSCMGWHKRTEVFMYPEIKSFLLNSSSKATLTKVMQEHCCDVGAGAIDSI